MTTSSKKIVPTRRTRPHPPAPARTCPHLFAPVRTGPHLLAYFNSGTNLGGTPALTRGHSRIVDALGALGLVSAYHAFHKVDHGHEPHATYRHQFKASQPWHLDFCFVPTAWASHISKVEVISGDNWDERSDHRPMLVDLHLLAPARTCSHPVRTCPHPMST